MRTFETGATRDADTTKFDYEGFLSPLAIKRFGEYMHKHRLQADGALRDSDNWQKGIPLDAYMKSAYRHFHDVWALHRKVPQATNEPGVTMEDSLCALLFNVMGYLHTLEADKAKSNVTLTGYQLSGGSRLSEAMERYTGPIGSVVDRSF